METSDPASRSGRFFPRWISSRTLHVASVLFIFIFTHIALDPPSYTFSGNGRNIYNMKSVWNNPVNWRHLPHELYLSRHVVGLQVYLVGTG